MWMNLDQLPAGKSMYTVYVTVDPEGTARSAMSADEVDVVAKRSAEWGEVCSDGFVHDSFGGEPDERTAGVWIREMCGEDARIIGVVNQSDGYVVFDAFDAGIETGANDRENL